MSGMDLFSSISKYIDLSALRPELTYKQIETACIQAKRYNFACVCINPFFTKFVSDILKDSKVKVCSVVGFPFGANDVMVKVKEAIQAINDGASELDIVWNISAFKSKDYKYIDRELSILSKETYGVIRKVIVETGFLNEEEKALSIKMLINSGFEFIKTSTGFNTVGAKVEDIKLFKRLGENRIKIKASGGIKDYKTFAQMIDAGADRIGTSSGVNIMEDSRFLAKVSLNRYLCSYSSFGKYFK